MNTTTPRPTPETNAEVKDFDAPWLYYVNADFARKLERERDEARDQLKAMREAIEEAYEALKELRSFYIEMTNLPPCAANAALAKLQLFIKLTHTA